jgi:signal transduction histidine kinase
LRTVPPDAIAGFLGALALTHLIVAGYTLVVRARQGRATPAGGKGERPEAALLPFGLLNLAVVALDAGLAAVHVFAADDGRRLAAALTVAEAGRVAAVAFLLHFVLDYARVRRPRVVVSAILGAAALLALGSGTNAFAGLADARLREARLLGMWMPIVQLPSTPLGAASAVLVIAAAVAALVVLGQSYLRGRREAVSVTSAAFLGITLGYDALGQLGVTLAPRLSPLGWVVFVAGVIMTLFGRFTALRGQLEERAQELNDRARDLARAYADLRAAQDELVRKEQLAAVGELSAVVAHEVRNPLAIISNAVATLRRHGISEEDRGTLLAILDEETTRLNRLVGDLLRYARPITLERQLIGLRELVERGVTLAEGKIGLDIELVETDPTERIWADQNLVRQVIENLIDNAIQAMSGGGLLTVTLANGVLDGAPGVEIQIADTGEGMDTEVRARALDPFFTTRPSGTGLGLAIVARIIDAHGGTLRIRSKAGAGTVMHVFLPRAAAESPPRSRRGEQRASDPRASDAELPAELARSLGSKR